MTTGEGVSLREAVEWCGGHLTVREAARLRQQAAADPLAGAPDGDHQVQSVETGTRSR